MLANRCSTAASMRATANSCSIICSTAPGKIACGSIRVSTPFSATGCGKSRSSRPPPGCIRPATGCLTSRRRQTSAIFGADVYHVEKSQLPQQRLRAGTAADGGHRQHGRALPAAFRHGLQQQGGAGQPAVRPPGAGAGSLPFRHRHRQYAAGRSGAQIPAANAHHTGSVETAGTGVRRAFFQRGGGPVAISFGAG